MAFDIDISAAVVVVECDAFRCCPMNGLLCATLVTDTRIDRWNISRNWYIIFKIFLNSGAVFGGKRNQRKKL